MSFRNIRPSVGDNSTSTSNPSQSTSESTGSDLRKEAETNGIASKRRRVPESVTRNACTNCKKARAKCDGKNPCTRCTTRSEAQPCNYEAHLKHAKEELVQQIKGLRSKEHLTEQILGALSSDEHVPEILQRLKNGETFDSIAEWLDRSSLDDIDGLSAPESQPLALESPGQEMSSPGSSFRWTTVTTNPAILDHLFQLYFAWVHPVHTLFSEGHFVDCYKRQTHEFCSSLLVNAMCAMACHMHTSSERDNVDFAQLAVSFSDAVRHNIDSADKKITTIQAFAVMFLVDCARAKALSAVSYLKIASKSLSNVIFTDHEGFRDVFRNTNRGIRCLDAEWAQITFQIPTLSNSGPTEALEENETMLDEAQWYFYRYVDDQCPAWPGLLATTNREKSKLIDIIIDATMMLYSPSRRRLQASQILEIYSRYTSWREDLPDSIGNIENNHSQALPHVLSLLILYSNAVIQLLRPLLDFEGFPSAVLEEVIWTHAQQGLFLLDQHYRTQYTCRYQPVLQMFAVLHLCDLILRFFPGKFNASSKDGPEAAKFAMEALMQSRAGFPVAAPLQELLRRSAKECSVRLPKNLDDIMGPPPNPSLTIDDFINACTWPTYIQPVYDIHVKYSSVFTADWNAEGRHYGFYMPDPAARQLRVMHSDAERGARNLMQIRYLLDQT